MGQALSPAHFLADIVNIRYQGESLSAEEEEVAVTWVSSNHPSQLPNYNELQRGNHSRNTFADEVK